MDVVISVDVEQDCPPFLHSYSGVANGGLQYLMDIFEQTEIKASFFVGADVIKLYPNLIQKLETRGHEIGCHGLNHRRFDQMSYHESEANIRDATRILGQYLSHPVRSFRAPNLHFPREYLSILKAQGYVVDSSIARYKEPSLCFNPLKRIWVEDKIIRIPVTITSFCLRFDCSSFLHWISLLSLNPLVLFVHPWEFIDFTKAPIRWDCRFRTGLYARRVLLKLIHFLKRQNAKFKTIAQIADDYMK